MCYLYAQKFSIRWVNGNCRSFLAAIPLPTLLPHTESSLKSFCPVNSDFYFFNWFTKGFKSIEASWQHLRQEWESSRATRAAASPNLQRGDVQSTVSCLYLLPTVQNAAVHCSWSVSQLKMRRKSENSEIWLLKCQRIADRTEQKI